MSGTFDTKWRPKQIQPVPDLTKENFKQTESRNLPADFGPPHKVFRSHLLLLFCREFFFSLAKKLSKQMSCSYGS